MLSANQRWDTNLAILVEVGLAIMLWQLGICCEHCPVLQPFSDFHARLQVRKGCL